MEKCKHFFCFLHGADKFHPIICPHKADISSQHHSLPAHFPRVVRARLHLSDARLFPPAPPKISGNTAQGKLRRFAEISYPDFVAISR